jgi:hypothetical protein
MGAVENESKSAGMQGFDPNIESCRLYNPAATASRKPWSTVARSQGNKRNKGAALSPVNCRGVVARHELRCFHPMVYASGPASCSTTV